MGLMSEAERARVGAAITKAEAQTDGEIYAVLARRSDDYFAPAAFAVSVAAILAALVAALVLHRLWIPVDAMPFMLTFALAWLAALAVLWAFPGLCRHLVPRRTLYRRAHLNASSQFLARNIHLTRGRTGILLFVSLEERYAEVHADAGIDERVGQQDWNAICAILIDHASRNDFANGFVLAIEASGALLARHFPKTGADTNEIDDHLIEL